MMVHCRALVPALAHLTAWILASLLSHGGSLGVSAGPTSSNSMHLSVLESYSADETVGTLVYACPGGFNIGRKCGGISDRIKGIITAFNMAVLLNQRFLIDPLWLDQGQGLFGGMLEPNFVDWSTSREIVDDLCNSDDAHRRLVVYSPSSEEEYRRMVLHPRLFHHLMMRLDSDNCLSINALLDPRQYIIVESNAVQEMARAQARFDGMSAYDALPSARDSSDFRVISGVINSTFHHLFRPSSLLKAMVASSAERLGFDDFDVVVAVHLRSWKDLKDDPGNGDNMQPGFAGLAIGCAQRIEREYGLAGSNVGWYFASDRPIRFSEEHWDVYGDKLMVQHRVADQGSRGAEDEEIVGHVDKVDDDVVLAVTRTAMRDMFLLVHEKVAAVGWTSGGFGRLSAAIAGKPVFHCGMPSRAAGPPEGQAEVAAGEKDGDLGSSTGDDDIDSRTAVCVTGQKRSLGLLYPDDIGENATCGHFRNQSLSDLIMCRDVINTGAVGYINASMGNTASSIHNHVYPTLAKTGFDVFVYTHSDDGETLDPVWEFLRPAGSSAHSGGRRNSIFYEVDEPEGMLDYNTKTMGNYVFGHDPRGIQGLLWQLWDQMKCAEMIKAHSLATNQSYRYVIRIRPDIMFISPFPHPKSLDLGDDQHPIVRFGSMDASCCGNEDWLGVGFFDIMMTYLSRFSELVAEKSWPGIEYRQGWIAEEFLEMVLDKLGGAKLVEEERMRYVRPQTPPSLLRRQRGFLRTCYGCSDGP